MAYPIYQPPRPVQYPDPSTMVVNWAGAVEKGLKSAGQVAVIGDMFQRMRERNQTMKQREELFPMQKVEGEQRIAEAAQRLETLREQDRQNRILFPMLVQQRELDINNAETQSVINDNIAFEIQEKQKAGTAALAFQAQNAQAEAAIAKQASETAIYNRMLNGDLAKIRANFINVQNKVAAYGPALDKAMLVDTYSGESTDSDAIDALTVGNRFAPVLSKMTTSQVKSDLNKDIRIPTLVTETLRKQFPSVGMAADAQDEAAASQAAIEGGVTKKTTSIMIPVDQWLIMAKSGAISPEEINAQFASASPDAQKYWMEKLGMKAAVKSSKKDMSQDASQWPVERINLEMGKVDSILKAETDKPGSIPAAQVEWAKETKQNLLNAQIKLGVRVPIAGGGTAFTPEEPLPKQVAGFFSTEKELREITRKAQQESPVGKELAKVPISIGQPGAKLVEDKLSADPALQKQELSYWRNEQLKYEKIKSDISNDKSISIYDKKRKIAGIDKMIKTAIERGDAITKKYGTEI